MANVNSGVMRNATVVYDFEFTNRIRRGEIVSMVFTSSNFIMGMVFPEEGCG